VPGVISKRRWWSALVVMLLDKGAKNDMEKLDFAHGGCQR
jgi:hypothetical protein